MSSYYQKHKEEIKAKQKNLYHKDKEFRKLQIQRVADYKKRKAKEKKLQKEQIKLDRKVWRKVRIANVVVECCRIAFLASALGRGTKRLREWESMGKLPKTILVKGMRYYTKPHYTMIMNAWNRAEEGKNLKLFFEIIKDKWDETYKFN